MTSEQKLSLFWILLIAAGLALSLFFGLGWLLLAMALRRALMITPLLNWVRSRLFGLEPAITPAQVSGPEQMMRWLGYLTVLAWTAMAIYAFVYIRTPLIQVFTGSN